MEKHRAIPKGFMTVGEVAKKMNTTVRTLQYYDREGLFSPSAESEGGRRLYTDKDIIKLHQIQSMKYLGFSLDDIKNRLVSLDTPEQVAAALTEQAEIVRAKLESLTETLSAIEKLKTEILQMDSINWRKYADIVVNLQMKNEFYGIIKYFDDKTLDKIRGRFDLESGIATKDKLMKLCDEILELQDRGGTPESEEGKAIAKAWWDLTMEFTGGDMNMLGELIKTADNLDSWFGDGKEKLAVATKFIGRAIEAYFTDIGINSIEEAMNT